ncbi:NYN domain-containing protein [Priestia aryabhattai]|uniref:NYN domain-containing protein n=1 Tax=Priestia aryabhattai TaxID=412384 RepID=UPI001C0CC1F2|nr:NYN domain-containing protein [Priestia aryabhattai]MBU3571626.1 NYN domain-containing protein [Priestia aryabhattai]WDL89364.1 NYN domain-containing protein [Priestia aryabhattai]
MDILLVDGYNMIGAWSDLRKLRDNDLAGARDLLIEKMAEYQAYMGYRVIIVFDAHMVEGIEKKAKNHKVDVVFTRENETADEYIEKLAQELNNVKTQIHVATSDFTEQWAIFGQGALRISARELYNEIEQIEKHINLDVKSIQNQKPAARIQLSNQVAEIFEKWRRGQR